MFGAAMPGAGQGGPQQQQQTGSQQQGQATGGNARHFAFGTPTHGGRVIFTFGGGDEQELGGPAVMFNPLAALFGGGQEGLQSGRMGDFVFSQGAMDK